MGRSDSQRPCSTRLSCEDENGDTLTLPSLQMAVQRGQLAVVEITDGELPADIASLPLDVGEKQTLHLALRDQADLVLLDDLKAREEAHTRGLAVKGTLGVIVQAYRSGLLQLGEVEAIVQAVISRDDIWIAEGLCHQVLARLQGSVSLEDTG